MLSTRDKVWNRNFRKLKAYIDEHHHLPDKKKVEHRGLLNWVKYNRKKIKAGTLSPEKERLFCDLLDSRHAGLDPASRHAELDSASHPGGPDLFSHARLDPASHPAVAIVTDQGTKSAQ